MTINNSWCGSPCGLRVIMRKLKEQSKPTQLEFFNGMKAFGVSVTKRTFGNLMCHDGLNSCTALKIPMLRKASVHTCHKFASEHLCESQKAWDVI